MALWARTQQLPPDSLRHIQTMYNNYFPIEIRHHFAAWIEEQSWKDIDESNAAHTQYAANLLSNLIQLINDKITAAEDFLTKLQFQNFAQSFQELYSDQPLRFVSVVKSCLRTEEECIHHAETMSEQSARLLHSEEGERIKAKIRREIDSLERESTTNDTELQAMQLTQERFVIDYQSQTQLKNNIALYERQALGQNRPETSNKLNQLEQQREENDRQLLAAAQKILQQRLALAERHKHVLIRLDAVQKTVVDEELIKWKRMQRLALNGALFDAGLIDILQSWCESLADLIWRTRLQIFKMNMLRSQLPIPSEYTDIQPELNKLVTDLLSTLVTNTFIVEEQPPQVLKKDARFTATVRLLVGGKLDLKLNPPRVKATIISEQQARAMLQCDEGRKQQKCGDVLNNEGPMDLNQNSGHLSIKFRNMSLKSIKRADRRGAEVHTVAEEKFCILFSSEFNIGGNDLHFQVWTLSLPVIVTVHGNQECQATATYLWDNQFSEQERVPFQVPDQVLWPDLAEMLSTKFSQMTGRGLSEENLRYLSNKLFNSTGKQDHSATTVTWSQFNKENLPGKNFTFWEWFWMVGKLVREHLKSHWNDETIIGFMDKAESSDLLLSKPNGTFLLRFSDTTAGGITIAWVADSQDVQGERQVWNLAPFVGKDFAIRGLADRIKDLQSLVTLYPDTSKEMAFSKYYSPATDTSHSTQDGYVKTTLINIIDGQVMGMPMNLDNPQTPQAHDLNPISPQSSYGGALTPHPECTTEAQSSSPSADLGIEGMVEGGDGDGSSVLLDPDFSSLNDWLARSGFNGGQV